MATLSIAIASEEQRKGYGRDALTSLVDAMINEWGIRRIQISCEVANDGAIALYESLGFVREATKRRASYSCGEHTDQHVYSLLSTDSKAAE